MNNYQDTITYEKLLKVFPRMSKPVYNAIIDQFNKNPHFDTLKKCRMFLACTGYETGGFTVFSENLCYSYGRLLQVFPKYFMKNPPKDSPKKDPALYIRNEKAIANIVYGNRMGNVLEGDGYRFRGRGLLQLTGRNNYTEYGNAINSSIPTEDPDQLEDNLYYCVDSAFWFWDRHKVYEHSDLKTVNLIINGGLNGYPQRQRLLNQLDNEI